MMLHALLLGWGYRPGEGRDLRPVAGAPLAAKLAGALTGESRPDAQGAAGSRDVDRRKAETPHPGGGGATRRPAGESANSAGRLPESDSAESLEPPAREALSDYLIALAAAARQSPDRPAALAFSERGGVVGLALSLRAGRPEVRLAASSGQEGLDLAVLRLLQFALLRVPVPEVLAVRVLALDIPVELSPGE
ncbi:MAG: hypothetical protein PHD19_06225 [Dechloromonas sp.]|nr:hypothetical protein [Dechloromonas sp.]